MKITVVVPVRNEEHSIGLLLQGLLEQTLPPAEIVIVDGGSTDATPRIVEEHARQHSHLHLMRETMLALPPPLMIGWPLLMPGSLRRLIGWPNSPRPLGSILKLTLCTERGSR
jgi:glycosyltransferase involved in cell wall biosynthesis